MYFSDKVQLVKEVKRQGDDKRWITDTVVGPAAYADVTSVTADEVYRAAQIGLHPTMRVILHMEDYHGEDAVQYSGQTYGITRTYQAGDTVELYIEVKAGDRQ